MPENSGVFEGDGDVVVARDDAGGVVGRGTGGGRRGGEGEAAGRPGQRVVVFHLMPFGRTAVGAVGIKLHLHRGGVEVVEKDLNLKQMLSVAGLRV